MANVSLAPTIGCFYQSFTDGGVPNNAGYIATYIAGGTTPQATYTTSVGNVQNANPIVLGADGRPPDEIWFVNGAAYRCDVFDALGNLIDTFDNISGLAASISGTYLPTAGGTMTGAIAMSGNKITGLAAASNAGDAVRYEQSPQSILTAKGSLITATSANTPAALAVGATNGTALTVNSNATTGLQYAYPAMRSYLAGCGLSTAGSSATMSIAAGVATDSTNVSAMVSAAIAKTTSAWSLGTAAGGLDTGAIANNTWYHFFIIQRVDTGVVDALFSLQPASPTMPANYTLKRRIGSGLTNGSAQWVAFTQDGDYFVLSTPILDVSTNNPGTSAVTATLASVPTGVNVWALIIGQGVDTGGTVLTYFSDLATTDLAPSGTVSPLAQTANTSATSAAGAQQMTVRTNTSAQIRYRVGPASSGATTVRIATLGWTDRRGRDA